jgi:serine/threonine-protein kinase
MQFPYAPAPIRLGPYELLQKLATGGMAEIYVARREGPHGFSKRIALKRILPQLAADPEFVAMFIDEARVCAQLTHPNLVEVFDFGGEGCELYMAMELVEGTTAAKMVRTAAARGEPVPTEVALYVALSVGRGLAHAHDASDQTGRPLGLIHRDVSPGNILISSSGAVKLGDFGIARAAEFDRRTEQGQLKGKLGYMSPEQVTGRELDAKSDQFTAAIVLAELLMARPLFAGTREMDVLVRIRDADLTVLDRYGRHIPPDVMAVLRRALSRRSEERFPTTGAYVEALDEVVRRHRLGVTPGTLVEWLHRVGLVIPVAKSGEHSIDVHGLAFSRSPKPPVVRGSSTVNIKESVRQPIAAVALAMDDDDLPPTDAAPAMYRVALDDVPHPVSLAGLLDLFVWGRVSEQTPISRAEGPYISAREYPELSRCCGTTTARWDESSVEQRNFTSAFRSGELPAKLFELATRRATGMFVVRSAEVEKKVYFVEGVPEVTSSNNPAELFGALLLAKGLALEMEIEMALAMAPKYGGRIGDALVGLGVLRPMDLARASVDHMRRRFVELAGWKQGQMQFTDGVRYSGHDDDTMPEALHPLELVARGIVESYSESELSDLLAPIETSLIFVVARAPVSIASLGLPSIESAVLRATDGRRTLAELGAEVWGGAGQNPAAVLRAIFIGLSCGLLASPAWPPGDTRESVPTLRDR